MLRLLACLVLLLGPSMARADVLLGRVPIWNIGLSGGGGWRSASQIVHKVYPGISTRNVWEKLSPWYGGFGFSGGLNLEFPIGVFEITAKGGLSSTPYFEGHAGVVLGWRSWHLHTENLGTYSVVYNVFAPQYTGVYLGGGALGVAPIDDDGVRVRGGIAPLAELGVSYMGVTNVVAAVVFDPTRNAWGGSFRVRHVVAALFSPAAFFGTGVIFMLGSRSEDLPIVLATVEFGLSDGIGHTMKK